MFSSSKIYFLSGYWHSFYASPSQCCERKISLSFQSKMISITIFSGIPLFLAILSTSLHVKSLKHLFEEFKKDSVRHLCNSKLLGDIIMKKSFPHTSNEWHGFRIDITKEEEKQNEKAICIVFIIFGVIACFYMLFDMI